jgi:hypothetical protein
MHTNTGNECNVLLNMYHTKAAYVIGPLAVGVSLQRLNQFDRVSRILLRTLCQWKTLQTFIYLFIYLFL